MSRLRRGLTAVLAVGVLAVGVTAATATASAAPVAPDNVATFTLPATGGIEVGPGGVPGGSFRPVTVLARPGIRTLQYPPPPAAVTFTVTNPAPYHYQYSYRYVAVSWRNLTNGKSGTVALRHWQKPRFSVDGYPASLSTAANVTTGAGTVVATVSVLREQYQAPPSVISVIPGLTAINVA